MISHALPCSPPIASVPQTVAMHSPRHRLTLLNHNLRWIDWPHSHGDPNEYWNRLGAKKCVSPYDRF